jgi:phage terminase large subunit-like protein
MSSKPKQPLRGAIKPRLENKPLNTKNRGAEVAELAESISMPLMEWQRYVLDDLLSINEENQFIRRSSLLIAARQVGKSHIGRMRAIAGLVLFGEKNQLIMSSNRSMALTNFRDICNIFENNDHLGKQVKQIRYANGTECIEMRNGNRLDVVAATRDGSRGRTADFLWIDEIREINAEAFAAALPVTRARPNSQTYLSSNAGDAFSVTLNDLREKALSNPPQSFGFYEYSAPQWAALDDRKGWAMANPSLGIMITEEAIEEALSVNTVENFRTETLCQWIDSLSSPWPHQSVQDTSNKDLVLSPGPLTIMAFDISPSRRDASLVMGQITPEGKYGVCVLETFHAPVAVDELAIAAAIKKWCDMYYPRVVCFDKYTTASVASRLERSGVAVRDISGQQFYTACSDLHDQLVNGRLIHSGQDALIQHMNNCAAKTNDSAWRIVRRKSAGPVDIAIGLAMVIHVLVQPQEAAKIYSDT